MPLNSESVIAWFTSRNSGVSRYFANASFQSEADSGGTAPTIGCHSVIDRPECVSRVMPPTTTIANTSAQHARSQPTIIRRASTCARGTTTSPGTASVAIEFVAIEGLFTLCSLTQCEQALMPLRLRAHRACLDVGADVDLARFLEGERERHLVAGRKRVRQTDQHHVIRTRGERDACVGRDVERWQCAHPHHVAIHRH